MTKGFFLAIFLFFAAAALPAQLPDMHGKKVAVYFSKKNFSFDDTWLKPLTQYVKAGEGPDVTVEDVKLQAIVLLGKSFAEQLPQNIETDSVLFLNEYPDLARNFIGAYNSDLHSVTSLSEISQSIDYVLVINPLSLGSYKTNSVYVRSNRIISEQIVVRVSRIQLQLFSTQTSSLVASVEACVDDRESKVKKPFEFDFEAEKSLTGNFLSKVFSKAIRNLNSGVTSDCN